MVEIDLVVLEIQKTEFGNFTIPVNNTLVCRVSSFVFLATDTLLCVLVVGISRVTMAYKNTPKHNLAIVSVSKTSHISIGMKLSMLQTVKIHITHQVTDKEIFT